MRARSLTCEAPCLGRTPGADGSGCRTGRFGGSLPQGETARCVADASAAPARRHPIQTDPTKRRLAGETPCWQRGVRSGQIAPRMLRSRGLAHKINDACGPMRHSAIARSIGRNWRADRMRGLSAPVDLASERRERPRAAASLPTHTASRVAAEAPQRARGCAALARPAQPATTQCAVCATPAICRIAASNCSTGWPPWIRWRSLMITDGTALMPWLW